VTTRVDIEDLQTTRTEKLLAVVLAIFLLIGGIWTYQKIDDWVRDEEPIVYFDPSRVPEIRARNEAQARFNRARIAEQRALRELELSREAYRTALDAGRPAANLESVYIAAQRNYRQAERERAVAASELNAARAAARSAERRLIEDADDRRRREERKTFLWRLVLVLLGIVAAYVLLWHLHGRESRYLPLAFAAVVSATLLALVMAGDYVTDYFNPLDLGPLILAGVGSVLTLAAFYLLQRYLARRLPPRRVRKGQCPFCGYPARENRRCEGCGREVVASCAACGGDRRVGVLHCGACGAL
jgi:hypothetical protein